MKSRSIDMTKGSVIGSLILFFLPILAGSLLQQLYTTVDAVIIGRFAGKDALAAIDAVYNLLKLPVTFFTGLSVGATILISRYFGSSEKEKLSELTHTTVFFAAVFGAALSVLGVAFAPTFLRLLSVPEDIFSMTLQYTRICLGGVFATVLYNLGAGILRAVGDSRTPVTGLTVSGLVNVVLDFLFIHTLHMDVAGAAAATVIAQFISVCIVYHALINTNDIYRIIPSNLKCKKRPLKDFVSLGFPVAIQYSVFPIANILVQSTINQTGTVSISAWAVCGKMDFLIWLIAESFGATVTTFVAQNSCSGDRRRIRIGTVEGLLVSCGLIVLFSIVLFFFCESLALLFIRTTDRDIIPLICAMMRLMCPFYVLYAVNEALSGAVKGMGNTLMPMINAMICTCGIRLLWIYFMVTDRQDIFSILKCYPASWGCTAVGSVAMALMTYKNMYKRNTVFD